MYENLIKYKVQTKIRNNSNLQQQKIKFLCQIDSHISENFHPTLKRSSKQQCRGKDRELVADT